MTERVAIIGGGLAGTACAYILKQAGYTPVIFEAGKTLASGASGNWTGLYNPRFYAEYIPEAQFYAEAFLAVSELFQEIGTEINHSPHGSLHLLTNEDKQKRFAKMQRSWGWSQDHMRLVDIEEASKLAGIGMEHEGLFLPTSGTVSPPKLCAYYAQNCEVRLDRSVTHLEQVGDVWRVNNEDFKIVILACGAAVKNFEQTNWLPIYTVRGQIAQVKADGVSCNLQCNLNYGGYITPSHDGRHVLGSTFQRWLAHTDILQEDNVYIIDTLKKVVPALSETSEAVNARASLRTSSRDRLPIIGMVPNHNVCFEGRVSIPNLYVTTAHGSHGIVTSYMAANMVLEAIRGGPARPYTNALGPDRFLKRMLRKER